MDTLVYLNQQNRWQSLLLPFFARDSLTQIQVAYVKLTGAKKRSEESVTAVLLSLNSPAATFPAQKCHLPAFSHQGTPSSKCLTGVHANGAALAEDQAADIVQMILVSAIKTYNTFKSVSDTVLSLPL